MKTLLIASIICAAGSLHGEVWFTNGTGGNITSISITNEVGAVAGWSMDLGIGAAVPVEFLPWGQVGLTVTGGAGAWATSLDSSSLAAGSHAITVAETGFAYGLVSGGESLLAAFFAGMGLGFTFHGFGWQMRLVRCVGKAAPEA